MATYFTNCDSEGLYVHSIKVENNLQNQKHGTGKANQVHNLPLKNGLMPKMPIRWTFAPTGH